MSTKRATIMDVAAKAGVSMMTVSRVLNKTSRVSDSAREKVMVAVKELKYRPNVAARRLASTRSFFLGLLYDNPSAGYVSQFLLGALKSCRVNGYHLVVDEVDDSLEHALDTVYALINDTKVDGVILLPPVCDIPEILDVLNENEIPVVRIAPDRDLNMYPYVCMDDYSAAFEMTSHLITLGHEKIGFIAGHSNQGASRLRYQGYLDALRSKGINVPPEYIEQAYFDYKSGMAAAENLVSLSDRPTAIFASNDDMAAAVVATAHKHKLDVPKDISVAGFDDTQIASIVWPQLTTIRQPISEMANKAIELLIANSKVDDKKLSQSQYRHVLDFELIKRGSISKK